MDSPPYLQHLQEKGREALRQANLDVPALAAVGNLGEGAARAQIDSIGVYESAAAPSGPRAG